MRGVDVHELALHAAAAAQRVQPVLEVFCVRVIADGQGVNGELVHVHAAHVGKLPT